MSSYCRRQVLIEAPPEEVWRLVGDPNRHPEWWPSIVEVKGLGRLENDARFRQVTRVPIGGRTMETNFMIEDIDDPRELKLRCMDTGTFSHWVLTEARGQTFAEIEMGMEPTSLVPRLFDAAVGKRLVTKWVEEALEGLQARVAQGPG